MLVIRRAVRRVGGAVSRRSRRRTRRGPLVALPLALVLFLALGNAASAQPLLDIDTADAETLAAALPGIGPVKARRIVAHRERHGPFGSVDALGAVKGIGPVTLERIRAHLAAAAPDASPVPSATGATGATARSSTELERAAREAVRAVVDAARRDALPYRQ